MTSYLIVALGSAIGGALRHVVNVSSARLFGTEWPFGTFTVNVAGSFAIGAVIGYFALRGGPNTLRLFLSTGIIGGFTTFSAFSLDVVLLYQRGRVAQAALYMASSVAVSIAALFLALAIVRRLL